MHVFAPLPQFFKNLKPPINKGEGSHYVHSVYLFYAYLHAKKQSLTPISLTDIDQRYWQSLLGKNLLWTNMICFFPSLLAIYRPKTKFRHLLLKEILKIKEYSNLTGRSHFHPNSRTIILYGYAVFVECSRTTDAFILDHFKTKLMTWFSLKFFWLSAFLTV